jgi:hypothetical protein
MRVRIGKYDYGDQGVWGCVGGFVYNGEFVYDGYCFIYYTVVSPKKSCFVFCYI